MLGLMLALGCTVNFSNFDARVRNDSSKPLFVEYAGEADGRDAERCAVVIPPGGVLERHLQGREVHAAVTVHRPGPGDATDVVEFQQGFSDVVILDHDDGITVERRLPRERP
jgi:hypothetical protein